MDVKARQRTGPADLSAAFGVTVYLRHPQDASGSLARYARTQGLEVASVDPEARTVKLQGTGTQYQRAFGARLSQYQDEDGREYRGYEGNLSLPAGLAGEVQAVLGLDDHRVAKPPRIETSRVGVTYTPPQVAALYHFPRGTDGSGQTIGIIELGGGYRESDLQAYFQRLGIKEPKVTAVSVDGASNAPTGNHTSVDAEVALDVEVAGSVAPGAELRVYFAPDTDQGFVDAVSQAARECNVVGLSWANTEDRWNPQAMDVLNTVLKDAAARGTNVFASSGDRGSSDGEKGNHVEFPASSPWAIGTGGTRLRSSNGQITEETAWDDLVGGKGGGGVSDVFPVPDFQKGIQIPAPGRGVPDVSGNASPLSGYLVMVDGETMTLGGTSAVAPLYAALAARLGQALGAPLGWLNPFFYQHPEAFNDITAGSNGAYSAGPGWDPVTGLGSPDGEKLLQALRSRHQA